MNLSLASRMPLLATLLLLAAPSWAEDSRPVKEKQARAPKPRVGGHLGLATSLGTLSTTSRPVVIGRDFAQVGITPGLTVKLNEHWSFDFEFIAFSRREYKGKTFAADAARTLLVVDPGVIYDFGFMKAGLRAAMQLGEGLPANIGLVPIVVKAFPLSESLNYFVELDLPLFYAKRPGSSSDYSASVLIQTGVAF